MPPVPSSRTLQLEAARRGQRTLARAMRCGAPSLAALSRSALLFTAVFLGSPSSARAESELPLRWASPARCPDAHAVMGSLTELMDVTLARWDRFRSIRGRLVALSSGGFELELVFEGPSATRARRFRMRDCKDSADLAAAALALALDPRSDEVTLGTGESGPDTPSASLDAQSADSERAQPLLSSPEPASFPASAQPDEPGGTGRATPGREPSPPLEIDVGIGGVLDPNGLGAVGFGGSAWSTARLDRLSLGLHADWLPQANLELGARAVHAGLAAAGIRFCYAPGPAFAVCPEFEAGWLHASGAELDNGRSVRDPWLAPGLGVELRAPVLAALSLLSRVAVLSPLTRTEYLVNGGELLHRTPAVVLRLSLGFELTVSKAAGP